jgi:hypothetical protein
LPRLRKLPLLLRGGEKAVRYRKQPPCGIISINPIMFFGNPDRKPMVTAEATATGSPRGSGPVPSVAERLVVA